MSPILLDGLTAAVSLVVALALYPFLIRLLRRAKAGQVIQAELPESHQKKAGTPTGGGMLFVALGLIGGLLATLAGHPGALPALAGLAAGGVLGLADDLRKLRVGSLGIPARLKLPLQILLAIPVAWLAHGSDGGHQLLVPFDLGWLYWPLALIALVATANAVNLTDGMDGLAGSLALIAVAGLALLVPRGLPGERVVAFALCGCLLSFLIYNRHPARVFMGDTGSLALGYAVAAMAIEQGALLLLPLLGLVFVIETLSVIIQVAYFKATGGRRIFKMTPIHYTFRLEGWSENRIVLAFSSAGVATTLASGWLARLW